MPFAPVPRRPGPVLCALCQEVLCYNRKYPFRQPSGDRGLGMALSLRCSEICREKECDFRRQSETEDEVFQIMAEHFKAVHGLYGASQTHQRRFSAGRSVGNRDDGRLEAVRLFPT